MKNDNDGGAGTSHMNMKIIRDEHYTDSAGTKHSPDSASKNKYKQNSGKTQDDDEHRSPQDLDAMLDDDDFFFEETLDRASHQDHVLGGNGSGRKKVNNSAQNFKK